MKLLNQLYWLSFMSIISLNMKKATPDDHKFNFKIIDMIQGHIDF